MEMTAIERQQQFIKLAAVHAKDFKTRVAQHDRENSFPFENIEAMKALGYTIPDRTSRTRWGWRYRAGFEPCPGTDGPGDGPTAVTINMHLFFNVGILADLWHSGDETQRPFLQAIARDRLIWCFPGSDPRMNTVVGFTRVNDTTRYAEKVEGGYRVNGRSGFGTLSACADFHIGTAHYDDPERGRCQSRGTSQSAEKGGRVAITFPQGAHMIMRFSAPPL